MGHRESDRVSRLTELFGEDDARLPRGIGDDAAVARAEGVVVTSVDAIVEGVHFHRDHTSLRAVGHKAAASALSDLAAMGVPAGEVYVAAGLPEWLGETEFDELSRGIAGITRACGAVVAGGDMTASPVLWLAVTVVGHAPRAGAAIGRNGARVDDVLAVTGELGGSRAGLCVLTDPAAAQAVGDDLAAKLRDRHLLPQPRLAAGRALATSGAHAMIDLSDGLARDAVQLAASSGGSARVRLADLPIAAGTATVAAHGGHDPYVFAAESGEEYELLCALAPEDFDAARRAVREAGCALTAIGEITGPAGPRPAENQPTWPVEFLDLQGRPVVVAGYEHFN